MILIVILNYTTVKVEDCIVSTIFVEGTLKDSNPTCDQFPVRQVSSRTDSGQNGPARGVSLSLRLAAAKRGNLEICGGKMYVRVLDLSF